jgi:hypothetical protein
MRSPYHRRVADRVPPDFVIVGAMKSGTSSLWRYLADHPRVASGPTKELHFFDSHYGRGLDWYRRQFSPAPGKLTGEATPAYLRTPAAIDRLGRDLPDTKLIAILRHPVERAYSHFNMIRSWGTERREWDEVVRAEIADPATSVYLAASRYGDQLAHLHRVVAADRIRVFSFEALRDQPQETFGQVCDFLGVERMVPASVGRVVNAHFEVRSRRARAVAQRLRRVPVLPAVIGRLNQVETDYVPMSETTRRSVHAALAEDAARAVRIAGWAQDPWRVHETSAR